MNISLDGRENDLSFCLPSVVLHGLFDHFKSRLGCFGAHKKLGQENRALFKAPADKVQGRDQFFVDQLECRNASRKKRPRCLCGASCHTAADTVTQGHFVSVRTCPLFSCRSRNLGVLPRCCRRAGLYAARSAGSPGTCGHRRPLCICVGIDIAHTLGIHVREGQEGPVGTHHVLVAGIHNGAGKPHLHGHSQKMRVYDRSFRKAEGNIRHPQDRVPVQFVPDAPQSLQGRQGSLRIGGNRHGQTVDHNILPGHSIAVCRGVDLLCDRNAAFRSIRNAALVQDQSHDHTSIFPYQRKYGLDAFLLSVHGVDHGLAVVQAHAPFHGGGIRSVDLQGKGQNALQS